MPYQLRLVLIITFNVIVVGLFAQASKNDHHDDFHQNHKLTFIMANSLINHIDDGGSNGLRLVPTFGLNYDYLFNSRWGVGIHTDIIVQQFKIESHNNHEELIRENPVAVCGILTFSPVSNWNLLAGYGVEIEKHENIQVIRVGTEYGIHLPKNWELGFMFEYDYKINNYGSLIFGVGFSKFLGKTSNHDHKQKH